MSLIKSFTNSSLKKLAELNLAFFFIFMFFENYLIIISKTNEVNQIYLFSLAKVYFLFFSFFVLIIHGCCNSRLKDKVYLLFFFMIVLLCIASGFIQGNTLSNIASSIQYIYFWFVIFCSLVILNVRPSMCYYKIILPILFLSLMFQFVYSLYIHFFYDGNYSFFYFYKLYDNLGMFGPWNHLKDGIVRAYGLFGSSTGLSQVLLLPILTLVSFFLVKRNLKEKTLTLIFLFLFLSFLYIAKIRNPILALCFSIMFFFILKSFRKISFVRFMLLFVVFFSLSLFLINLLSLLGIGDLSSQARIPMLLKFYHNFIMNPFGYGVGSTGNLTSYKYFYESSFATIFSDLGLFFGLVFYIFFLRIAYLSYRNFIFLNGETDKILSLSLFFIIICLLFLTNFSNIFDSTLFIFVVYMYSLMRRPFLKENL